MLTANKQKWFERLFDLYMKHSLLKRHFHRLEVKGDFYDDGIGEPDGNVSATVSPPSAMQRDTSKGTLYMMNHSSWWDGLIVYYAARLASSRSHYMMMEEEQLRKYAFFRKLGAFSINKSNPKSMMASLRYSQELLEQGASVWLFPQGDIYHQEARPLTFFSGAAYLAKQVTEAPVVPVTLYYSLTMHQKNEASLWLGDALPADWKQLDRREWTKRMEVHMEKQLDAHRSLVIAHARADSRPGFYPLFGKRPVTGRQATAKHKAGG
ncbi:lysophospholipid acyltransferase family protein [Marinicrinis sediminis]|uniref:Lysophospholipid acyltransferase family protein n=1 Tax=Marinicrinis sediminis TaxID=1652465 RepID=A0ABW5R5Q2_9BACL